MNSKACVYNLDMKQAGKTSNANRILENLSLGIEMNLSLCFKVRKSSEDTYNLSKIEKLKIEEAVNAK